MYKIDRWVCFKNFITWFFFYILWGTHGDHPTIVLSASTVRECYDLTIKSFNFSEKFRTRVVLLIDEVVAHMREKMVLSEEEEIETFHRIKPTVPPEDQPAFYRDSDG